MEEKYIKQKTCLAFLASTVLGTPFWAIYSVLAFILYKDLQATPIQIAVFIALRPLVALFSLYWSAAVNQRPDRLKGNIIWASMLGPLPCLFFPFMDNPWMIILSSAFYMTLVRGVYPAWMEILKLNFDKQEAQSIVSYSTILAYVGGGILALLFGYFLDLNPGIWRLIFPLTACLSITSAFLQSRICILSKVEIKQPTKPSIKELIFLPWKMVGELIKAKADFRRFHFGYMLGGFGLVIIQPALPHYFMKILNLSYTELATAITLCKGIAFALSSRFWSSWLSKVNIYRFSSVVALLAGLFPLLVIFAQWNLSSLFIAYLLYGVMQSGSELSWHLSGPIFSKDEDSSAYSSVNLAVVGLRGCFAPLLGSALLLFFSPTAVLLVGSTLALYASYRLDGYHRRELVNA